MWDHSHINNDTHRLPHIRPYIFTPLHQPKTPVFAKNCHPKSQCHTVQVSRILEIFHSKTPNRLEFEKKVPKCHLFCSGFCHWKTPYFFAFIVWGECCLKHGQKLENFVFSKQNRAIFLPCIHMFVWGECCLKHGQKLENVVFSKQNRAIWGILSGANLIKVMKIKFHFYRLDRPNCAFTALYGWISLEGRDDTGYYPPIQTRKGIYPINTLYKSAPLAL